MSKHEMNMPQRIRRHYPETKMTLSIALIVFGTIKYYYLISFII